MEERKTMALKGCGRTVGHGDSCGPGYLCGGCDDKVSLLTEIEKLRANPEGYWRGQWAHEAIARAEGMKRILQIERAQDAGAMRLRDAVVETAKACRFGYIHGKVVTHRSELPEMDSRVIALVDALADLSAHEAAQETPSA